MNNKKNIDDLFKEQLQNFEASPSPAVWNNIQAQMKKEKEDRKVIPLWWKLGGVAAVLALLLIGNAIFDPFGNSNGPTLVEGNPDAERSTKTESTPIFEEELNNGSLSTEESNETTEDPILDEIKHADQVSDPSQFKLKEVAAQEKQEDPTPHKTFKTPVQEAKQAIAGDIENSNKTSPLKKGNSEVNLYNETPVSEKTREAIARSKTKKTTAVESVNPNFKTTISEINKVNEEKVATIKEANKNLLKDDPLKNNKTNVPDHKTIKGAIAKEMVPDPNEENKKKSIFDAIEEDKEAVIAAQEEKDLKNWEVTPNFGPVFYNSLDGGSSIDATFADNAQNTETNFSYGVQISYAVNPRLSIRSGVSNVNLGYTTEGLELATGPTSAALKSIDYGARQSVTTAVDKGALDVAPPTNGMNPFENLNPKSTGGNASLTQNLSYYEIPL
jgi:hypothetical protein